MTAQNLSAFYFNRDTEDEVKEICRPLFEQFDITHFGYAHIKHDGEMLRLATDTSWTKIYFDNFLYNDPGMYTIINSELIGRKKIILSGLPKTAHEKFLYEHNLWNCLAIHEHVQQGKNFWFFCSTPNNAFVINYYLNYPEIFDHFTNYFLNKAQHLLDTTDKQKLIKTNIVIRQQSIIFPNLVSNKTKFSEKKRKSFILKDVSLTYRELECLSYLFRGYSMKDIAKNINISARTVETHINHLKAKASLNSKQSLIDFFLPSRSLIFSYLKETESSNFIEDSVGHFYESP